MAIVCLDLKFHGQARAIAAYAIPYTQGIVLVDCGPASTLTGLQAALEAAGLDWRAVTHVLLTHIHLDHAGAAGILAQQGAQIYVHPLGAPHLVNPEKLLNSARRLYGEHLESLWGDFQPLPAESLVTVQDGQSIAIGELHVTALHTPGHAEHHVAYLFEDVCFAGDLGGVRRPGPLYLRLPFVPPETHLTKWRTSVQRLQECGARQVAVSHFGLYPDALAHWALLLRLLDETEVWLRANMDANPPLETLTARYTSWLRQQGLALGIDPAVLDEYDQANPALMNLLGLQRYWQKVIQGK